MTLLEAKQSLAPYGVSLFIQQISQQYMVQTKTGKRYVTVDLPDAVISGIELAQCNNRNPIWYKS